MPRAKQHDTVKVHYTGKLPDGSVVDSSVSREPLQFTIGDGEVITGVEQAIVGMAPGESKTAVVEPDDAFGQPREDMIRMVERTYFPGDLDLSPGKRIRVPTDEGEPLTVTVIAASESTVTVDANHPLAGKPLVFDLQLVDIL